MGRSAISCARAADHMSDHMKKRIREIHRRSKRSSSPHAPLSKVALQISSVVGFLLLGCAAPEDRATDRESTAIISYWGGDEVLNPVHDMEAKYLVFLSLMTVDQHGNLKGRLARSWEHSPDYRERTFHLRTDVHWHDGIPVTAHDIAFTIDLMRSSSDTDYNAFELVTVQDDSTVTIRPRTSRIFRSEMVFYPEHLLKGLDPSRLVEWEFWKQPVGNGPYRFVRLEPETMMEFEANPDFFLGRPRIDRVILRFSLDDGITELLGGQVDADRVPPAILPTIANDSRFRIYHNIAAMAGQAVYWKSDHAILGDPVVRRALTHAIDRRALHHVLNYPDDLPIFDAPHTPDQYRRRELLEPLPYDPDLARALLDRAGWQDTDGDEIRDRDGQPLRFTALVENVANSGTVSGATFVQSELRKIGVQMELRPLDRSVVLERFQSGDFEAVFLSFRFWEAPVLQNRYHLGEPEPLGYRNPRVVELLDQAARNWIPEEDDRIYSELAEIFRRDMPVTILYPYARFTVAHRRLRGLSSPYWGGDPTRYMDELWLEDKP